MTIDYSDGYSKEAKVSALGGNLLRVAIENGDDAVEFRLLNGRWFSEALDEVPFEFGLASEAPWRKCCQPPFRTLNLKKRPASLAS